MRSTSLRPLALAAAIDEASAVGDGDALGLDASLLGNGANAASPADTGNTGDAAN